MQKHHPLNRGMAMYKIGSPIALALLLLLVSCCVLPLPLPNELEPTQEIGWRCPSVPETFGEDDLVGTWQAIYFPNQVTDTLVLRENGMYQQVYENRRIDYYYTSEWNHWYVEHRSSGGLYLHLERMRYCVSATEVCIHEEGGGSWPYYDPCENRSVRNMGNEVILIVQGGAEMIYPGIESDPPRGIVLRHMRSNAESPDAIFVLQE